MVKPSRVRLRCGVVTFRVWELSAVALATTGCSLFMHTAPSDPSERVTPAASECTSSVWLPTGDALAAAVGAVNVGISAAADDQVHYYGVTMDKQAGLAIGITQLAVFGAAAAYGYVQASRCLELRREVHLDSTPAAARESPREAPEERPTTTRGGPTTAVAGAAAESPPPGAPPTAAAPAAAPSAETPRELPSWSALRRVPLTATRAPHTAPARFSGSPP